MALQLNVKIEDDDLTDLDSKIVNESTFTNNSSFGEDMVLNEYQSVADHSEDNTDIIHTLIEGGNEPVYVEDDQCGQQFLTLSQGNNRIAVNDNGSIVYTDSLAEAMEGSITPKREDYFQTEVMGEQYLQESQNESVSIDNIEDGTILLRHDIGGNIINTSNTQFEQLTISPGGIISQTDANNMITIQRSKAIKRSLPTPAKNVVAKVYVQNTKIPSMQTSVAGRSISFAQAQRLGILPSKIQQVLSTGSNSQRIVVKKVVQPGNSNVLIRSPQKIMPAPGARDRITITGVRPNFKINPAIRTNVPVSQLKTFLTTTTAPIRAATLNKTFGGMTLQKVDGRTQQVVLRQGGSISNSPSIKIPTQISGKQHVQYVKIIGNSGVIATPKPNLTVSRSLPAVPIVSKTTDTNRVIISLNTDEEDASVNSPPASVSKDKQPTNISNIPERTKKNMINIFDDIGEDNVADDFDPSNEENTEFGPESPQRIFEANGIRPKKPCNCTRSQCLKLYCECFANGEFCFECNCNNCFNNIEHEEERQNSIKSCLDRNPAAFRSKIKVADSDDEEPRQNNKGCNCKRSHCLKNYCECFETKVLCGKNCKCTSCRNTQEDMAAWVRGEDLDSGNEEREPSLKSAPHMSQALAEALCQCILVQAETSERKGDDIVVTEQRIIEELGQRLVQIIGNRSKKDSH